MHSDHRQPGCAVIRAALALPRLTTSTLVLSGVRVSSGESKLFTVRFAICLSSGPVFDDVEIEEPRRSVEKGHLLLGERGRLGQVGVLHGRLVRVEEHDDQVAVRVVVVPGDEGPLHGALTFGRREELVAELLKLVILPGPHLDDLDERHRSPSLNGFRALRPSRGSLLVEACREQPSPHREEALQTSRTERHSRPTEIYERGTDIRHHPVVHPSTDRSLSTGAFRSSSTRRRWDHPCRGGRSPPRPSTAHMRVGSTSTGAPPNSTS